MQHIEQAGVHSGDSSSILPPVDLSEETVEAIREATRALAKALKVVGLMNIQFAIASDKLYVIEVNPRASRTVPFIAKATGIPLAGVATQLMLGTRLIELGYTEDFTVSRYFVKSPVFPFLKFPGVDPKLSPEMKSTGEVMGIAADPSTAYLKAQLAAGIELPRSGRALITVNQRDHQDAVEIAKMLIEAGFDVVATRGTAATLRESGLEVGDILKQSEGRPNCVDAIRNGEIGLIVNTPLGASSFRDGWEIRTAAIQHNVPCITTLAGARAAVQAVLGMDDSSPEVGTLQEFSS
jgi:carbamoyl-phosphate synthase large subunit